MDEYIQTPTTNFRKQPEFVSPSRVMPAAGNYCHTALPNPYSYVDFEKGNTKHKQQGQFQYQQQQQQQHYQRYAEQEKYQSYRDQYYSLQVYQT